MVRVPSAATSAMRLPDWRYREAVRRVGAADKPDARVSDRWVGLMARFLGNRQSSPTHVGKRLLKAKMPATATAFDLAREGGELRFCVEARILAGDLPDWIAHESGIPVAAIEMFERIFFDVRGDRNRSDFILRCAIGPTRNAADSFSRYWRTVKLFCWLGGPLVADEMLCPGRSRGFVASPERVADDLAERSREALRTNAAVLLGDIHLDNEWRRELAKVISKSEFEPRPDQLDGGHRAYTENVITFLNNIELSIGRRGIPTEKQKYYFKASEPRAHEWEKISRGEATPELDLRIARGCKRPPPTESGPGRSKTHTDDTET